MVSRCDGTSQIPGNPSPLRLQPAIAVPQSRLDRLRGVGAAFVRGTTHGWNRRDLADWLVCQYAPSVTPPPYAEPAEPRSQVETPLDEARIEAVIAAARGRVLRLFADIVVPWQATPVARLAVASGAVAAERDERGAIAYAPMRQKRMRLSDRVASLFIADYLNRPADYRWVGLCCQCGELAFSTDLAHPSWCDAPPEEWLAFTPAEAIHAAAASTH